jgi:hypothetical protein
MHKDKKDQEQIDLTDQKETTGTNLNNINPLKLEGIFSSKKVIL